MANLWRVLAIAWLGGFASPVLAEEPPDLDGAPPAAVSDDYRFADSLPKSGDTGFERTVDGIADHTPYVPRE